MPSPTDSIATSWSEYQQNKQQRSRDHARSLGISEAELLASGQGQGVSRLEPEWSAIWQALPSLGPIKTITRNEHVVLELWASYAAEGEPKPSGPLVDVRLFFRHFAFGFAVDEPSQQGLRRSLQFFDRHGDSVHKVYLEESAHARDLDALVRRFAAREVTLVAVEPQTVVAQSQGGDAAALRAGWDQLQDTHDFVALIRRLGLGRVQALELAGPERAKRVENDGLHRLLSGLSAAEFPCMIFVPSRGLIQIYSGPIRRVKPHGDWLNVLDPELNLHVRQSGIASSWVVKKPTSEGIVTSLELYDQRGETLALLFGRRSFGAPESETWRALLAPLTAA